MKEIDFDELDRAVNSIMADTKTQGSSAARDEVAQSSQDLSLDNSLGDNTTKSHDNADADTAASSTVMKSTSTSITKRRGGRFMDMVPSSGAKRPTRPTASREGLSVPASASASSDGAGVAEPESISNLSEDTVSESTVDVSSAELFSQDRMPDPLDIMMDSQIASEPVVDDIDTSSVEDDIPLIEEPMPLSSPFLPDTRVDKRPLGTPVNVDVPVADSELSSDTANLNVPSKSEDSVRVNEETSSTIKPRPFSGEAKDAQVVAPESVPAEFHEDLLEIESTESDEGSNSSDSDLLVEKSIEATTPDIQVPSGAGYIPQQYKESPDVDEGDHVPIYDTAAGTPQLTHPAKSKSGWLIVVWIVALILVAVGSAVTLHYLDVI